MIVLLMAILIVHDDDDDIGDSAGKSVIMKIMRVVMMTSLRFCYVYICFTSTLVL